MSDTPTAATLYRKCSNPCDHGSLTWRCPDCNNTGYAPVVIPPDTPTAAERAAWIVPPRFDMSSEGGGQMVPNVMRDAIEAAILSAEQAAADRATAAERERIKVALEKLYEGGSGRRPPVNPMWEQGWGSGVCDARDIVVAAIRESPPTGTGGDS